MAHVCLIFGRGHVLVTSLCFVHSTFKFFTSHLSVYQCDAYLWVSSIYKLERIVTFK